MELVYSMRRKPLKCEPPHFGSTTDSEVVRPICTISIGNIIAFSSLSELSDVDGDTWGGHVYVCDLDTPWDSHKVTSTVHPITTLEWDFEGKQLLVGTSDGEVSVFGQKEYLLNEWTCLYSSTFPGEKIIKGTFFQNGLRVTVTDKKPEAPVTEKYVVTRNTPTLKGFGGSWSPGALVVTSTGLVATLTPNETGCGVLTAPLPVVRMPIAAAATMHQASGNVLLGTLSHGGGGHATVRCFSCSVSPRLRARALQALRLGPTHVPVAISWCYREDTECLLVAGAALTLWKLTEKAQPLHKLFTKGPLQGSTTPGGGPKPGTGTINVLSWQVVSSWPIENAPPLLSVSGAKLPLGPLAPLAALGTINSVKLNNNQPQLVSRNVSSGGCGAGALGVAEGAGSPPKKTKYSRTLPNGSPSAIVSSVDMSHLGGVVVCVDTHAQLHVYRVLPDAAGNSSSAAQNICNLLEYAMVTGYDYLDVLMSMKSNMAELIYERVTESFQRHPQQFQQYYFHSWLKLRIALCRISAPLSHSGSWLWLAQAGQAAWAAVCVSHRADDNNDLYIQDLREQTLVSVEAKPESVGDVSGASALRRLLQRALDIAVTMLAAFAYSPQATGYELWNDPSAVNILRKLVVVARACGCGGEALSRPLARLQASGPKHDLQEECLSLASAIPSRVWDAPPRCSVSAPHAQPPPLYLEYGSEPESLRFTPESPGFLQAEPAPTVAMDSIRYMHLGGGPRAARWRQCGRCGARALPAAVAKHPLQHAADARFHATCRCGGKWTLVSNV